MIVEDVFVLRTRGTTAVMVAIEEGEVVRVGDLVVQVPMAEPLKIVRLEGFRKLLDPPPPIRSWAVHLTGDLRERFQRGDRLLILGK
jgi:translation elongation factor EF-Tu-like GTPase